MSRLRFDLARDRDADRPAVQSVYARLAPFYDLIYGATLEHGRRRAMRQLSPQPGDSILEVGVGTGLSALLYPRECRVAAIDLSAPMLARARTRLERHGATHVRLCRMDAGRLAFRDAEFDAVYAPYVLNVVPDPIDVAREMRRVCRPNGRIVLLNHFDFVSASRVDRVVGRVARFVSGVDWHLDLHAFLREVDLVAVSTESVNVPRVSSVVVCRTP
ncbi:MAG TPA: methyltransferase domain-containing protein [Vicinamibacterales bacterium]|nr:methyltransferase domain-containing protein [Vicinamibacterales bacterium]